MPELVSMMMAMMCLLATPAKTAQEAPEVRLERLSVAKGGWTVVVQDDLFLVIAAQWHEQGRGRPRYPSASYLCMVLRPDEEGCSSSQATWQPIAPPTSSFFMPRSSGVVAAVPQQDGDGIYLVDERYSGIPLLLWTLVREPGFAPSSKRAKPSGGKGTPAAPAPASGWTVIAEVRDSSGPSAVARDCLQRPSLVTFQGRVLLAGDAYGAGRSVAWVGAIGDARDRGLDGVVAGPGWAPTLVPAGDRLLCLAIGTTPPVPVRGNEKGSPGTLVAWESADGVHWEPWAPGVPLDNVVRVDACSEGDTTLVACLTAAPDRRIHVYRLDPDKVGLTELLTVDPAPEGELGCDIAIRLLKGSAYLFWQDHLGAPIADMLDKDKAAEGKTYIVMRRLELPAEGNE
jgi:hypothetical protein